MTANQDGESVCVLDWCDDKATAGHWCRRHWDETIERDVQIEAFQSSEYLARQLVMTRRALAFVTENTATAHDFGQCCGHLFTVHTWGGCNGLVGSDDDWRPCKCLVWLAADNGGPARP